MDEEIRKARSRQYGSFLYCPDRDCLCFGRETELQRCWRSGSVGKNSMRENAIGRIIRSEETILYMKSFGFGQNYEN